MTTKPLRRSPVAAKQSLDKAMATVSELALAGCKVHYGNFGTNFANQLALRVVAVVGAGYLLV